jgi:hypothetical protein
MKIYIAFGFPAFEGLGSSGVLGVTSLNVLKKLIKVKKHQVHVLRHLDMVGGSSFPSLEAIPHSFFIMQGRRLAISSSVKSLPNIFKIRVK